MVDFLNFFLHMISTTVGMFFDLPLTGDFTVGDGAIALIVITILLAALVGQLRTFNLRHEAGLSRRSGGDADE